MSENAPAHFKTLSTSHVSQIFEIMQNVTALGAPRWNLSQIEGELGGSGSHGLGLFIGEDLAAFILFRKLLPEQSEISYLASGKLFQNQGIMTKLFKKFRAELEKSAPANGEIWLEVHEQNLAARALYDKLGFKAVGRRNHYYSDSGHAILYSLKLKP